MVWKLEFRVRGWMEDTMLFVGLVQDALLPDDLQNLRKQRCLLVVMVAPNEFEPGEAVANEICVILWFHMWCLQINAIIAPQDGIVEQCHMRSTLDERVCLD